MNRFHQASVLLVVQAASHVFSAHGSVYPGQVFHNRLLAKSLSASVHRCSAGSMDWMECVLRCMGDVNCVSYNFNSSQETCEVNSFGLEDVCGKERLIHSKGVMFQQLREEKVYVGNLSDNFSIAKQWLKGETKSVYTFCCQNTKKKYIYNFFYNKLSKL